MKISRPDKKEIMLLMITGCLLGILCFAFIYGFKIVNFSYNGWLFNGDMDLRQHYVGFCHFRNNPWHFPIGIIDTLSVPNSMSVVYTDSIPLFALVFKLFRNVLPVTFQYMGFFGLTCYMLMGALSPVLIRRFSNSKIVCIAGSLFYTLSFPVLHRLFYHTALTAQWIIILAMIVWFYTDITDKTTIKRISIYWALIGVISVFIHSYFVFMTAIALASQVLDGLVKIYVKRLPELETVNGKKKGKLKLFINVIIKNLYVFIPILCFIVFSFAILYILGGFYGSGSVSGDGFGSFNANLSSYINPLQYSSIFRGFKNYGFFEYEGFAYVGAGILLILASGIVSYLINKKKNKDNNEEVLVADNYSELTYSTKLMMIFVALFVLFISTFPTFSFGSFKIISIPVPEFVRSILGICRTNARFVWVGMYIIISAALWFVGKNFDKIWVKIIFALALVIQLYDMSGTVATIKDKYVDTKFFDTVWMDLEDKNIIDGKKEFVFMYDHNDIMMDTAYYGYLHGISQNSFYYARTIYDEIDENVAMWHEQFLNKELQSDVIYIFRKEDYTKEFDKVVNELNANKYVTDEHIIITKR